MIYWKFKRGSKIEKAIFSKLNGSEPSFDHKKWNENLQIKKTHNCYAYVLDIINDKFNSKPQPGYSSGFSYLSDNEIRACDKMFERIKADNPSMFEIPYEKACPKGYRKGYLAVDDGENTDYHFWRLDSSGLWSHKPGSTNARMDNYNGNIILAPHKSKRESNSHVYNKSCGYFCFDPKYSKISNKPIKKISRKTRKIKHRII